VNEKMTIDIQTKIGEYIELIKAIQEEFNDPVIAMAVLHELRKDARAEEIRRGRGFSSKGELPATEKQIGYVETLGGQVPQSGLTRSQASRLIDSLRDRINGQQLQNQAETNTQGNIRLIKSGFC
jgi:hypothetical protein